MSIKRVVSDGYNYIFDTETGFFVRWGKTKDDDPFFSPFGPEIADIEVSTICSRACSWCYKSNTLKGKNMTFETFKTILDKIPKVLTQIAFGIGDLNANPDLKEIMLYTRRKGFIPNITITGDFLNDEWAKFLAGVCGAVAVSHYIHINSYDNCYDAVKMLSDYGLAQVSIHKLIAKETEDSCYRLMLDYQTDERLKNLKAIVFLGLKQKGNRNQYHPLSFDSFKEIVDYALFYNIPIGFDSCSAHKFLKAVENHKHYEDFKLAVEPCESACFSMYINVDGLAYPCSFLEGESGYSGIQITDINNFIEDVWFSEEFVSFREKLAKTDRKCPHFKI